jgi:hypothetical protein
VLRILQQSAFFFLTVIATSAQPAPQAEPARERHSFPTSQLSDWHFRRDSPTRLSFGEHCLPDSPCNVSIGGVTYRFTNGPWTLTLSNKHAGIMWVYIGNTGTLTLGLPSPLKGDIAASSSLAVMNNVNSLPTDVLTLARWDVSNGTFSRTGTMFAAYLSYKPSPLAGSGIQVAAGSRDVIGVDTSSVLRKFTCAGGSSASVPKGATLGDVCWDFNAKAPVMYVCSNANGCAAAQDWKKAAGQP